MHVSENLIPFGAKTIDLDRTWLRKQSEQANGMLVDPFERHVTYLRVSVTDRCDFRCEYCMSEDMKFLPKQELLSLEELERICKVFIERGVKRLRISGGEPLVRRDIMWLFRQLGQHLETGWLEELTLTTNGSQLKKFAAELFSVGVRRINVSLDTLIPEKFKRITRRGDLSVVLEGLISARNAGHDIKINTVALRGFNDMEFDSIIRWCGEEGFDLTLIETMPMGQVTGDRADQYLPLSQVRADLQERWALEECDHQTGGPARYMKIGETGRRLGFITPLTHNFCESCNRIRLTSTGILYMCLGQEDAADLRTPLRLSPDDDALLHTSITEAIGRKPRGHDFAIDRDNLNPAVPRHMNVTGG